MSSGPIDDKVKREKEEEARGLFFPVDRSTTVKNAVKKEKKQQYFIHLFKAAMCMVAWAADDSCLGQKAIKRQTSNVKRRRLLSTLSLAPSQPTLDQPTSTRAASIEDAHFDGVDSVDRSSPAICETLCLLRIASPQQQHHHGSTLHHSFKASVTTAFSSTSPCALCAPTTTTTGAPLPYGPSHPFCRAG